MSRNLKLAVVEAGNALTDAGDSLKDAEDAIEDSLSIEIMKSEAEADLAAAELNYQAAVDEYEKARQPYSEDDLEELRQNIAEAESDIDVVGDQTVLQFIEIDAEAIELEEALDDGARCIPRCLPQMAGNGYCGLRVAFVAGSDIRTNRQDFARDLVARRRLQPPC